MKLISRDITFAHFVGEHLSESFGKDVNRFHKLPAINDNGFKLSETVAIFHYLGRKEIIPERWYPKDLKTRARIDEFLQWNHNNLHLGAGMLFFIQWILPFKTGVKPSVAEIDAQKRTLVKCLDDLDSIWLKDNKFLTGSEVTFADLIASSAIEQVIGMRLYEFEDQKHGNVKKWIDNVRQYFGPSFMEAHQFVYKYGKRIEEGKQ